MKNMPSVIVLDKATPPTKKALPKGTIYASVSFVASALVGLFIVFILELFGKIKMYQPEKYAFIIKGIKPWKRN